MTSIPLRLSHGKPVGFAAAGVATLDVTSRHWFRQVGGYSIDAAVLRQIRAMGCTMIRFRVERREVRAIPVSTFLQHAVQLPDYGFGLKLACAAKHYLAGPEQMALFPSQRATT